MGRGLTRSRSKTRLTATEKRADNRKRSLSRLKTKMEQENPDWGDSDDEYSEEPYEPETESIQEESVVERYKLASKFTQQALAELITNAVPGAAVADLCKAADDKMEELCKGVFNKPDEDGNHTFKGVAFPTSVSLNDFTAHFAPHGEAVPTCLEAGDVAKVHMGCHVDGYAAQVAHTIIVGGSMQGVKHEKAGDVMKAAHTAAEAAMRLMRPDLRSSNDAVTNMFSTVATDFGVVPCEGVLSHRVSRWNSIGPSCVISVKVTDRDEQFQEVEPVQFGSHEVWHIDVVMSSGHTKLHCSDLQTTIFRRNEILLMPRIKAAHYVLKAVREKLLCFPFSTRHFDDVAKARLGLKELQRQDMVDPIPVMKTKKTDVTARFSWTVMLTPKGVVRLTGLPLPDYVTSQHSLKDESCRNILRASLLTPSHPIRQSRKAKKNKVKKQRVDQPEAMDAD